MDLNDLNKVWEINQTPEKGWRRRCKESSRKGSKTSTTHHEKTQMECQSPV